MSTRCHVVDGWRDGESITLDRDTSRHLARVLRVRPGDGVELFDGLGGVADAEVCEVTKDAVRVNPARRRETARPKPFTTLVQALIRPQPMDYLLRKATELGVSAVQPVLTERCVARTRERPARWRKTIISAAEQCGANWLPEIRPVRSWTEILAGWAEDERVLLCALSESARPLKEVLRREPAPARVAVLVGPEGDLTPAERDAALNSGAIPVSLGSLTLRAETASLYALSALRYEFG